MLIYKDLFPLTFIYTPLLLQFYTLFLEYKKLKTIKYRLNKYLTTNHYKLFNYFFYIFFPFLSFHVAFLGLTVYSNFNFLIKKIISWPCFKETLLKLVLKMKIFEPVWNKEEIRLVYYLKTKIKLWPTFLPNFTNIWLKLCWAWNLDSFHPIINRSKFKTPGGSENEGRMDKFCWICW